ANLCRRQHLEWLELFHFLQPRLLLRRQVVWGRHSVRRTLDMTLTSRNWSCLLGVTLFSLFSVAASAAPADKKPNVVFILVDNVGWGNFGVYGGTVATPRIDQLA